MPWRIADRTGSYQVVQDVIRTIQRKAIVMKKLGFSWFAFLTTMVIAALAMNFGGCARDNPLGPQDPGIPGKVVQSKTGTIHILGVDAGVPVLRKGDSPDSVFYAEKFIVANEGGTVEVGDKKSGVSKLIFEEDDLKEDTTISLLWAAYGLLEGEFGPHGTVFNNPVRVELSYKLADLTGVDENSLQIYYYNEATGLWEPAGGKVNTKKKKVIGYLPHFSRYAVAWSR